MTGHDVLQTAATPVFVSTGLAGLIVWLSREWISAKVKASIQQVWQILVDPTATRIENAGWSQENNFRGALRHRVL